MMREEMKESPLDTNPVQHSHDFFVISSCRVFARLLDKGEDVSNVRVAAGRILGRFGVDVKGLANRATEKKKRTCLPLAGVELEEVAEQWRTEGWSDEEIGDMKRIVERGEGRDGC